MTKKESINSIKVLIMSAIAMLTIVFVIKNYATAKDNRYSSPTQTIETFIDALARYDVDDIINCTTGISAKNRRLNRVATEYLVLSNKVLGIFINRQLKQKNKPPLKSAFDLVHSEIFSKPKRVEYSEDGKTATFYIDKKPIYELRKIGENWKIDASDKLSFYDNDEMREKEIQSLQEQISLFKQALKMLSKKNISNKEVKQVEKFLDDGLRKIAKKKADDLFNFPAEHKSKKSKR